jgi:hypothetical protein
MRISCEVVFGPAKVRGSGNKKKQNIPACDSEKTEVQRAVTGNVGGGELSVTPQRRDCINEAPTICIPFSCGSSTRAHHALTPKQGASMKRLFCAKPLLAAAVAFGALAATSAAHARPDVVLSIGVQAPFGYVQPAPVYVQPQPGYYGSHRSYERGGAWGDADRDGVPNVHDRDSRFYDGRAAHRAGAWADADRDGVPNRYDRAPNNPYRR